jgi:hypothetical protein
MAYASREEANEYKREHYRRNKAKYCARANERRQRLRVEVQKLKEKPCTDCKQAFPYYVMDFDHRPGTVKLYEPNELALRCGRKVLEAELAKCDLVCSNCHRIRTYKRSGYGVAKQKPTLH